MTRPQQTGYQRDQQGVFIEKDPGAELTYALDWSDWLKANDEITSVTYSVSNTGDAVNDIDIVDEGSVLGYQTYVTLNKGVVNKVYTVTVTITTTDLLTEERHFRVKVKHRSI